MKEVYHVLWKETQFPGYHLLQSLQPFDIIIYIYTYILTLYTHYIYILSIQVSLKSYADTKLDYYWN